MSTFLLIVLLFLLFVANAFFSLAETAIFATNRYKIRHQASEGNRRAAQLVQWLDQPESLLATILLGSNFASISAATLSAALVSQWIVDQSLLEIGLVIEAVLLTIFILLFCELGPKALAARYPDQIAMSVVIPIEICMKVLSPLAKAGIKITSVIFRNVKDRTSAPTTQPITGDEIRAIIAGGGDREERTKMIERVLEFSERQVKDVTVPRPEVVALEMGTDFEEILRTVESTRYTRFPVYRNTLDNVAGVIHGKDLMPYIHSPKAFRLSQLLRRPVFIPDTAKMDNAIRMLQSAQTHMGIVVDEHGGVLGIVTVEDLIEQIVGEIQDEHDVEVDAVVSHPDGSSLIDSSISVRELNERLPLEVPESGQYITLAGFLLRQSGRLLKEGEEVTWNGHSFRIEQVMGRRIMKVRLVPARQDHAVEAGKASQKSLEKSS
jgi:putative hemolysin